MRLTGQMLSMGLVMFVAITFTFFLIYVIPGDPAAQVAGPAAGQREIDGMWNLRG